jgi:antitoxin component YwqK of YwqJK toxin-antitoxin module
VHGCYGCRALPGPCRVALNGCELFILYSRQNYKVVKLFSSILGVVLIAAAADMRAQSLGSQVHSFVQVYDTIYGIQLYDKFNPITEGDSIRKYTDGHLCNGMIEDHYPEGGMLHKGFYTDGQLTEYTNYYPNGEVERTFKAVSDRKTELKKYYQNKVLKSDVLYYQGNSTLWQDYYDNGKLSYLEEYDKDHERLLRRCSYFKDGTAQSIFVPLSQSGNIIRYSLKEYFPNGQLQEESESIYNKDSFDFVKDGDDKQYDEKGNLVGEYEYVGGMLNRTIK